jgi:hypothetical protein
MKNRGQLALGIILILIGAFFIAQKQIPALAQWMDVYMQWPLNMIAGGGLLLVLGLLLGVPSLAVPAAIIAGIGGILYYQQMTGDGGRVWAYMWTLIPGFIGVGTILAGLFSRDMHQARSGINLMVVSAVLFIIFAAYFGKLNLLGSYGPAIVLVVLGVWVLIRGLFRSNKSTPNDSTD